MDKRETITASNLGPVVSLLTWIMAASVIIAVGIKIAFSSIIFRKRVTEDAALLLATIFSAGFSVSTSFAAANGIGRHLDELSSDQLESVQKALYAANILLVFVSGSVQASVLLFFREITPDRTHRRLIYALAVFVTLFHIPSILVAAFPCRAPEVWKILGSRCIDQPSFWEAFAGVNIAIEGALVALPVLMVYPLMMERRRKVIVISSFSARLAVIGAFAAQLYYARSLKNRMSDWTFHTWTYLLTTVFVQGLSIITVCIPYIRNLLLGMESGMIQTGHFKLPNRQSPDGEHALEPLPSGKMSTNSSGKAKAQFEEPETSPGDEISHP